MAGAKCHRLGCGPLHPPLHGRTNVVLEQVSPGNRDGNEDDADQTGDQRLEGVFVLTGSAHIR